VDLGAVKAASAGQLGRCAILAAMNGQGLLHDAEVLAQADCPARAYSLAALAVEECGKAAALTALAIMPDSVRAQAPVGRLLAWHQLKQVGGVVLALMPLDGFASRLAALPAAQVAQILGTLAESADQADRLKRRGLYVDMDRGGQIRDPSEISGADVTSQLNWARQATASVNVLLTPEGQARLASPLEEGIQLAIALVSALAKAGYARTPQAAADVILSAVSTPRPASVASPRNRYHRPPASVAELARTWNQERRRCAALLARPPPGSAFRTPARHGRADTEQQPQTCPMHLSTDECCTEPSSSAPIFQLAGSASRPPSGRRNAMASPA